MKIVNGDDRREVFAVDSNENVLGKGFINEFMDADIYEGKRVNYFIEASAVQDDSDYTIRKFIVGELINRAKNQRKSYPHYAARVYNCCFADEVENISFFKSIEGFKHDEGMHILTCDLKDYQIQDLEDKEYEIKDNLKTNFEIEEFIAEHRRIFGNAYSTEKINKLKEQEGFKSIGVYDNGKIIANILLFTVEEEGIKFGCLEDMYVASAYRKKGLGERLVKQGLAHFKALGLRESRVEVWSANVRATSLYYKHGYKYMKETEASIGMAI